MTKAKNLLVLFIPMLILSSCKKEKAIPEKEVVDHPGKVTPVGSPDGTAESKVIGAAGGTFTTADGKMFITFPEGALTGNNTITIQPVTNNAPGGTGKAYRITPHNVNFAKPVKITFTYNQDDLVNTTPQAMSIACQDSEGIWRTAEGETNDTTQKKVTISTNHFSDWSLFKKLAIVPGISFVDPGGSITLKAIKTLDDDDMVPVPNAPLSDSFPARIKEWKLAGAGSLVPHNDIATYTAPAAIPDRQPVAVSAELQTKTGKYLLVANIYIGKEGLTFRVDKGPWMHAVSVRGVTTMSTPQGVLREFIAVIPGNATIGDGVTLRWMGHPKKWDVLSWALTFPYFQYSYHENGNSVYYVQYSVPGGTTSPGGITFFESDEVAGSYTIGAFNITRSGKTVVPPAGTGFPSFSNHLVEGFFKIKWAGQ